MFRKSSQFYPNQQYSRMISEDLDNPKIKWRKVKHKGHLDIVEPVNPETAEFTIPITEFDLYKRLPFNIGWYRVPFK